MNSLVDVHNTSRSHLTQTDGLTAGPQTLDFRRQFDQVFETIDPIPGWLSYVDGYILWSLNKWYRGQGVRGDLLEIGVFHGRSAVLLGALRDESEIFEVCDVFDSWDIEDSNIAENNASYPGLTQGVFKENYLARYDELPVVHDVSSSKLPERMSKRRFRLIHIDGSHLYENVLADLAFSKEFLIPGGLVVLDDWSHSDHPGVAAAIWKALLSNELIPVVSTDMKLYAVWKCEGASSRARQLQDFFDHNHDIEVVRHCVIDKSWVGLRLKGWSRDRSRRLHDDWLNRDLGNEDS